MKKEVNFCDNCSKPLLNDTDGYIVQGNVYFINGGGLIGNGFMKAVDETIKLDDIKKYTLCKNCFKKALYMDEYEKKGANEQIFRKT